MNRWNPFAPIGSSVVELRRWLYEQRWVKTVSLAIPVISIGNITMGGTGKTPFLQWLLHELTAMGFHPGVVSRNYKTKSQNPGFVTVEPGAASRFGDEAVLLKMKNPQIPIYSGPQKWRSATVLARESKDIDVIVIDDGFQHWRLQRDFDIVLLDTSVAIKDYDWPPWGRARESLSSVKRANTVVFTKTEQSNKETQSFLEKECAFQGIVLHSRQKQGFPQWVRGQAMMSLNPLANQKALAFCGLGHPKSFLKGLKNQNLQIAEFKFFSDHFIYDQSSVKALISLFQEKNCDYLITSEKDFVKLLDWPEEGPPLYVVPLEHQLEGDLEGFRAELSRCLRKRD